MMNLKCSICGLILNGNDHPDDCPYCGTPIEQFVETEEAVTVPSPKAG